MPNFNSDDEGDGSSSKNGFLNVDYLQEIDVFFSFFFFFFFCFFNITFTLILAALKQEFDDWKNTSIFQIIKCCGNEASESIINGENSMNAMSEATIARLK